MERSIVAAAVLTALFAACESATFPDSTLEVEVSAAPVTVAAGDSVVVEITTTNRSGATLRFKTPSGCLTAFEIRDASENLVGGPGVACTTMITEQVFAPGESRTDTYTWRAFRSGTADPLEPGTYELVGVVTPLNRPPKLTRPLALTVAGN